MKISKLNAEFLCRASENKDYVDLLNRSDLNIVDGRGVLWSARYLTLPVKKGNKVLSIWQMIYSGAAIIFNPRFIQEPINEAIPGIEAFELVIKTAIKNKVGVFFFGAEPGVINKAVETIKKNFPKLKVSGFLNGYDFQNDDKINVVETINKTDAKILVVALGSPRQESWINDNINKLDSVLIAVGEGGTLDRVANPKQKAPVIINKIGLEWLWRTIFNKSKTSSRNRFQRFLNSVPLFISKNVKWKIRHGYKKN